MRQEKLASALDIPFLSLITSSDGETIYNAMRLASVGVKKGEDVSVFMLGKGVLFERAGTIAGNL